MSAATPGAHSAHRKDVPVRHVGRLDASPTQPTRGGGRSTARATHRSVSSAATRVSRRRSSGLTATTGGSGAAAQASHSDTRPPQASTAWSTTTDSERGALIAATGDCSASQQAATFESQHEGAAGSESPQQAPADAWRPSAATRWLSDTSTSPETFLADAHANNSAGVWQQQDSKHCAAVTQPQGLFIQGNGVERSFPSSRLAALA